MNKEENTTSLSDESYIPSGLQDSIIPYTLYHLVEDKRVQPIHHCQYIHLNLHMIHINHLVDIIGTNGIDPENQL